MSKVATLNNRELAAVLAGLRLVQRELPRSTYLPQGVQDIYDDGGSITPLDEYEIDDLCEALNLAESTHGGETWTPAQHKLAAIRARINGVWDHPFLTHYGPMSNNAAADIMVILNA